MNIEADINKRYIYKDVILDELKGGLSRYTSTHLDRKIDRENFKSSILILRVRSSQSHVSLAECVNHILKEAIAPSREGKPSIEGIFNVPRVEGTIVSARGREYSKPVDQRVSKLEVKLGTNSPGVEFNQRVICHGRLIVVWKKKKDV
jgi:hypothetical protein